MIELNQAAADSAGRAGAGLVRSFGGDVLNTAVYAARHAAGRCRVAFATALGDDPFSDDMLKAWEQEGLETNLVIRFENKLPGLYAIFTDQTGERSFYYWREQSAARALFRHQDAPALSARLADSDMLYFSGISLAILDDEGREDLLSVAEQVRAGGGHVAFDPNYRPRLWPDVATATTWTQRAIRMSTLCLPGLEDTAPLGLGDTPSQVAETLRAAGVEEIVVKDGPKPNTLALGNEPPVEVGVTADPAPVDTTAAGDSFNGAYLAERLLGTEPMEAVREGRAMAAWVIRHRGAIVPRRKKEQA